MPRLWPLLLLFAACLLACGLYANVLDGEFQFDDQSSIVENAALHSHQPAQIFRFWPGRYLAYQSFALQHRLSGLDPRPYHLVNALLHGLASALCGLWVYALAGPDVPSRRRLTMLLLAAGFFLLHPLQSQAVAYVVQRATALAAACCLGSLAAYVHGLRADQRWRWHLLAWLAALAAMFCKEFAIVLPGALALCDLHAGTRAGRWRRLLPFAPLLAVVPLVAALGDSFGAAGSEGLSAETARVSRLDYARTQGEAFARYLRLIVLPWGQNVDHHLPWHGAGDWPRSVGFALFPLATLGAALWCARSGRRAIALGLALFLLWMAPESSVFPIQDAMFEHRLYLPMAAVAWLFAQLRLPRRAWLGIAVYMLLLGALTMHRNQVWRTPLALWSDAAAKSPQKGRPRVALGVEWAQAGRLDLALRELELGLRLDPNSARGWTNLGNLRQLRGEFDAARLAYERALALRPRHVNAWYNLGALHDRRGDLEAAARCYERALEAAPSHGGALNSLAAVRLRQGRIEEARALAERAAALGVAAPQILRRLQ